MDTAVYFSVLVVLTLACCSSQNLTWQEVFKSNPNWEGKYIYKNQSYWCNLYIHSVDSANSYVISTFTDGNVSIELHGQSYNDVTIYLEKFTSWHIASEEHFSDIFKDDEDILIVGHLKRSNNQWVYLGEFQKPSTIDFRSIYLSPDGAALTPHNTKVAWKQTLPLALSLTVAVIGLSVMIGMVVWARRKGYLRHVPFSYKTFTNSGNNDAINYNSNAETVHI